MPLWTLEAVSREKVVQVRGWGRGWGLSKKEWRQTMIVQFFRTIKQCWGSKWPNAQSNCTQIQIVGLFSGGQQSAIMWKSGQFLYESATQGKSAIIVKQSWKSITAKSAEGVARSSPRHLSHPVRAGYQKTFLVVFLVCSAPIPSPEGQSFGVDCQSFGVDLYFNFFLSSSFISHFCDTASIAKGSYWATTELIEPALACDESTLEQTRKPWRWVVRDFSDSSEGLEQKDTQEETGSARDTKVRVAL